MAQRNNVSGAFGNSGTGLFEGIAQDHRDAAVVRDQERQQREADAVDFRERQVAKAMTNSMFTDLKTGSPAYDVATAMFTVFPTVTVPKGSKVGRTTLAFEAALVSLDKTQEDVARSGAIRYGRRVARDTLMWAFAATDVKSRANA